MMSQYSLKNQGPTRKELTKTEKLDSTSVSPSVVATARPSEILAYTQIVEPIVDPVINHSIVTYWSVDDFKPPSWISSVIHAFIFI